MGLFDETAGGAATGYPGLLAQARRARQIPREDPKTFALTKEQQNALSEYLIRKGIFPPEVRLVGPGSEAYENAMSVAGIASLGTVGKIKAPRDEALKIAQKNAAKPVSEGGLGLRPDNTPMERARAMGFDTDYYHGTERLDRLLEGKSFNPKRATSGPMPFGTSDKDLASGYAMGKSDTSLAATDVGEVRNYFQVSSKDLGIGGRSPYSVEQSWYFLPQQKKQEILGKATRVGYEDIERASGPYKLHPEGVDASLSSNHYDWLMKHEARGNPLTALRMMWHDGGSLVGSERELADIYKLAGYDIPISQYNAPWTEAKGVFSGLAKTENPLRATDFEVLKSKVIPQLEEAFKRDRSRTLQSNGTDMWDKRVRFTPREWVAELKADVEAGKNSHVWTSIPDKVTEQLKRLGYDSILDVGGKMGGKEHQVVIPFQPNQIRSRFAAFDPARRNESDLLAGLLAPIAGLGLLYGGQSTD